MKAFERKVMCEPIDKEARVFKTHKEMYDRLQKGDEVLVQKREGDNVYLMQVEAKEAGYGIIFFKDAVETVTTCSEFPCQMVAKIIKNPRKPMSISNMHLIFHLMKWYNTQYACKVLDVQEFQRLVLYMLENLANEGLLGNYNITFSSNIDFIKSFCDRHKRVFDFLENEGEKGKIAWAVDWSEEEFQSSLEDLPIDEKIDAMIRRFAGA